MLRVFGTGELCEAEKLTSKSIYLLPIHYCIRHEVLGVFPEARCEVFAYPERSPQLWMLIRHNFYTRPIVFVASQSQLLITDKEIDAFFDKTRRFLLQLPEFYARILGIKLSNRMNVMLSGEFDLSSRSYHGNYFIIGSDKHKEISDLDVVLPTGYEFAQLDPETDAEFITQCWKFSGNSERDQFAAKIRRLPSVGIKSRDGSWSSFTVLDSAGYFNNQFTYKEHRKKGLANLSEIKLCQKVIEFGLYPMKFVEHGNITVSARTARSRWWSTVVDEVGIPVANDHRLICRRF